MAMQLTSNEAQKNGLDGAKIRILNDIERQCLRVLRCTAVALANSPGGLRFRAGTRPWLDALTERHQSFSLALGNGV